MSAMPTTRITLRRARSSDLDAINRIVEHGVMSWDLPERVKRLAMPAYRYRADDLAMGELVVGENEKHEIIGCAAWEQADPHDAPAGMRTLQLHGIYVDPGHKLRGVGRQLLQAAERAAVEGRYDSLLVKAQPGSSGFFTTHGMQPLESSDSRQTYAYSYWKTLSA